MLTAKQLAQNAETTVSTENSDTGIVESTTAW